MKAMRNQGESCPAATQTEGFNLSSRTLSTASAHNGPTANGFGPRRRHGWSVRDGAWIDLGFGKRNELPLARHRCESSHFPVFFRLLNPLSARGHDIPPNVARALQGGAAEKHEPRAPRCSYRDPVARTEHQKPRAFECLARDLDFTFDHIDRPLFLVGIERRTRARGKHDICIEPFREHPYR